MDEALFGSLCAQLQGRSERMYLHVMGEPLLHPRLPQFLDLCESYAHKVYLVTNGLCLAGFVDALAGKPALRQINVSLHGLTGQVSEGGLRNLLAAVKKLADLPAGSTGRIVQLRLWNKGAADPAFQTAAFRLIRETYNLPYQLEDRLHDRRSFMLADNVCIDSAEPFTWPSLDNDDYGGRGTCYGLRRQCAVLADGTVTACCLDNNGTLDLGSARERPLADILSGTRALALRKGFEQGAVVEELCRKCSYRLRFFPGRSNARLSRPGSS
jgi:MoaA/NifB/PqqE/SkfB family radical SAM enzyme